MLKELIDKLKRRKEKLETLTSQKQDIIKAKDTLEETKNNINITQKGNIYKISAELLTLLADNSEESKTVLKSLMDIEKIGNAINVIYSRYDEPLNLDMVSALCGYSKSSFCKMFKAITGESFHSMLNRHRIEVACLKLKEHNTSIEKLALSVGFADSKSFCRVFKKITGKNTGEYVKVLKDEKGKEN